MTPSEPPQCQPAPPHTAMSPHRLLGIVRTGGLEPARSGEHRGNQNPVASKEKDPHRNQHPVQRSVVTDPRRAETRRTGWRGSEPGRPGLTTSCAPGPDGEASDDSRPAERQRGHPGIHAAAERRGRGRPPACCVGRTRARGASSDCVEPPSPNAAALRYPAGSTCLYSVTRGASCTAHVSELRAAVCAETRGAAGCAPRVSVSGPRSADPPRTATRTRSDACDPSPVAG